MTNYILHPSQTRGLADHGWLVSRHTFSFADYYNPDRMNFGALRVLNDDVVAGGKGFGTHPHANMEIISIPLEGDLEHRDSMGNISVIRQGDIQVMSAGSGITHSEYNKNLDKPVKFLQIWVVPNQKQVTPRYGQLSLDETTLRNRFQQIVSPQGGGDGVWIHQEAWFHLGCFEKDFVAEYPMKKSGNGVYLFVIQGDATVDGHELHERDGLGIVGAQSLAIQSNSNDARILLMEVPMV